LNTHQSFVIADIPGIIEGAAQGAGLGLRFLRHLERTRIFLHLIDVSRTDPEREPLKDFSTIGSELESYGKGVADQIRWVILTKIDLIGQEEVDDIESGLRDIGWIGPIYRVSAATGKGCETMMYAIYNWLVEQDRV